MKRTMLLVFFLIPALSFAGETVKVKVQKTSLFEQSASRLRKILAPLQPGPRPLKKESSVSKRQLFPGR